MSLPIHTLPIVERWDCHQCGFCCKGSIVPLNERDVSRLREQQWENHPGLGGAKPFVKLAGRKDLFQLNKRADGSCVFLLEDGLCRIHKELGFAAKPLICRTFPLQLIPHEKEAILTLRRACPSAAADKGRELSGYLPEANALAEEGRLAENGTAAPTIKQTEAADWKRSRLVLEALRRITCDERYPPIRRLVHGLEFCRLLDEAKTMALENRRLSELVQLLEKSIATESAEHFAQRKAPSTSAKVIFRQLALEVVRLHPRSENQATWSTRFELPLWAWSMLRGKGKLPRVHPRFPEVTFAQLEEPLGKIDLPLVQALARYFETSTASYCIGSAEIGIVAVWG